MNELALFAGAGGGILGAHLAGWRTVCAVERDAYAAQVLAQRQNDGCIRPFPIWSDVSTFDGRPWRGIIDVVSGGFPCQDISIAGKGAGIDGARSGLWTEMARIICEIQPCYVLVENSPALTARGLGRVLGDLAAMGFDAEWGVVSAADTGAPHLRERIWIVAHSKRNASELRPELPMQRGRTDEAEQTGMGCSGSDVAHSSGIRHRISLEALRPGRDAIEPSGEAVADANSDDQEWRRGAVQVGRIAVQGKAENNGQFRGVEWPAEPGVGRMAHGVTNRVDRLTALGNGQVPRVAATAWHLLSR